jgi:hypothetical protein
MAMRTKRYEWVLVVNGGSKIDRGSVEPFIRQLREVLGDAQLTIKRVDSDSALIVVESSDDAFRKMLEMLTSERTVEVGGMVIQEVFSGLTPPSQGDYVQQIPSEQDFAHSNHPLPPHLLLTPDLPIEIPGVEDAHMSAIHREQMRQAKLSFNCALPLGVIGILVAIWGAASWPQASGKASFGIGAIMDVLTFVLLRFHSEMNRRLDEARREVMAQRREDRLFLKVLQIVDPAKRDEAIAQFLKAALGREMPSPSKRTARNT